MKTRRTLCLIGFFASIFPSLWAQTFNWTGTTDGNWATAGNWSEGAVTGGATTALIFGDTTRLTTANNLAGGLTLNALTFTAAAGGYAVGGPSTLTFGGVAPTLASFSTAEADVTISAPIQLDSTLTVSGDAGDFAGQLKLTGGISGAGGLVWASGVGVISGANTYAGGTTVSGGAFAISNDNGLGTGAVAINGGALQVQNSITVTRALTLSGAGAEGLDALHSSSGANTWSGAITLAGDATIGSFVSASASSSSLHLAGALALEGHALTIAAKTDSLTLLSGVISGFGSLRKTGAGLLAIMGSGNTFTGNLRVEAGTLQLASSSDNLGDSANTLTMVAGTTLASGGGNPLAARSVVLEGTGLVTLTATGAANYAANFSGTAGLLLGSGGFELTGNNTFSGGLKIGTGSGTSVLNYNEATSPGAPAVITLDAGRINFLPTGATFATSAAHPVALTAAGGTLGAASGKTITVATAISGDGKLTLSGLDANLNGGAFILTGNNAHAGGVRVSRATLEVGSDAALGGASGALDLNNATLRATAAFTVAGTRSTTITGNGTVDTQAFDVTFGQAVGGDGQMIKTGSGELTLAGTSAGSLHTILSEGSIATTATNALGTGSIDVSSGTTLTIGADQQLRSLGGSGHVVTQTGRTLTLTDGTFYFYGSLTGGALIALEGENASYAPSGNPENNFSLRGGQIFARSNLTLAAGQTIELTATGGRLAAQDYNTLTVDSVISGAGALTVRSLNSDFSPSGDGTVELTAANTYAGGTVLAGGNLVVATDAALGTGAITLQGGTLVASGARNFTQAVNLAAPSSYSASRLSGDAMTFVGSWSLDGDREISVENTTTLNGGILGGVATLTKSGSGMLLLNSASALTGDVIVQSGVFGGNGSLAGNLVVQSYATLAPGMSAGLMTITGDLSLLGQSYTEIELGGLARGVGGYDAFDIGGTLFANGTLTVSLINGFSVAGGETFLIFDAAVFSGNFSDYVLPTLGDGLFWDTTQLASAGVLSVSGAAAIPEPSTWAALLGGVALGLAIYRRRRAL